MSGGTKTQGLPPGFTGIEPRKVAKIGRNDACPCGSGRKYKDCHEREGTAWLEKLARDTDLRERRERMKADGVPWYKRLLVR
jgi:hypothetical protein